MLALLKAGKTFKVLSAAINDVKAQVARLGFREACKVSQLGKDVLVKFLPLVLEE